MYISAFLPPLAISSTGSVSPSSIQVQKRRQTYCYPRTAIKTRPCLPSKSLPIQSRIQSWESLTATKFDEQLADNSLALCFVGMSNCGKSHWSRRLQAERHFTILSVDEEIERAIEPELRALGFSGIDGMAEWMGFPSDQRFATNQARYLHHEERITAAASPEQGKNCVLDTTGSVVYLTDGTLASIRQKYLVIHLEASDDMLEFMTRNYFETPKPVVWGDAYKPCRDETAEQALKRCYPQLLRERRKRYAAISHINVPASLSLSSELDLDGLLQYIKKNLGHSEPAVGSDCR